MPRLAALMWAGGFGLYLWWGSYRWNTRRLTGWPLVLHGITASIIGAAFGVAALFFIETRLGPPPSPDEPEAERRHRRWRTRQFFMYMGTLCAMVLVLETFTARDVEHELAFISFLATMGAFGFRGIPRALSREPQPPRPDSDVSGSASR